jgi:DDE superfamily endonuclease
VIPPKQNAEFVADMEAVLEVYETPCDPRVPVVCMDEQPVQMVKHTRPPIPATNHHPQRVDFEYERAGVASLFLFCEPLAGWRSVSVRPRHTKVDWAREMAALLTGRYAKAETVVLVCDHLATHTAGAFYEAFDPATARSLVKRLRFCQTPRHGSWLNVAECELAAMTKQCVAGRRFGTIAELQRETAAWHKTVNAKQRLVDWQFTVDNARIKLKSLYPKLIT